MSQDDYKKRDSGVATISLSRCENTAANGYKQGQGATERQSHKVSAAYLSSARISIKLTSGPAQTLLQSRPSHLSKLYSQMRG